MNDSAALHAPQIVGLTPIRPLGSGGFSQVYLYEENFPRRLVAVKVLTGDYRSDSARSVFETEVNTMAQLANHPSVVSVFGAGVATTGQPYLSLEYCPGSFREKTRRTPATLREVLDTGVRLAGALESVHRAKLLHRDIKPSNVLITVVGQPVLSDFGIALQDPATATVQRPSSVAEPAHALSIPWSAPEVVTSQITGTVASEVWALGATLYTFAAGHSPFEIPQPGRNTAELLTRRITQGVYTPLSMAGAEQLNSVLSQAMRVIPSQRIPSMQKFGEALQQVQRDAGLSVTPIEILEEGWSGPAFPSERADQGVDSQRFHAQAARTQVAASEQVPTRAERRAAHAHESAASRSSVSRRTMSIGVIAAAAAVLLVTVGTAVWGAVELGWL